MQNKLKAAYKVVADLYKQGKSAAAFQHLHATVFIVLGDMNNFRDPRPKMRSLSSWAAAYGVDKSEAAKVAKIQEPGVMISRQRVLTPHEAYVFFCGNFRLSAKIKKRNYPGR